MPRAAGQPRQPARGRQPALQPARGVLRGKKCARQNTVRERVEAERPALMGSVMTVRETVEARLTEAFPAKA